MPDSTTSPLATAPLDQGTTVLTAHLRTHQRPHHLGPIDPAAHAFTLALLTHHQPLPRTWLLCDNARLRERIHSELTLWNIPSLSLHEQPDSEARTVEDPESAAEHLSHLRTLAQAPQDNDTPHIALLPTTLLTSAAPRAADLQASQLTLKIGTEVDLDQLIAQLEEQQFERVAHLHNRGQYALRGGIFDLYTWHNPEPIRIELFDTEVDSIRIIDLHSQTSQHKLDTIHLAIQEPQSDSTIADYITVHDRIITLDCDTETLPTTIVPHYHLSDTPPALPDGTDDYRLAMHASPLGSFQAGDLVLQESKRQTTEAQLREWLSEDWHIHLIITSDAEFQRFQEIIPADITAQLHPTIGTLTQGFSFPSAKLAVLSTSELFGRYQQHSYTPKQKALDHQRRARSQTNIEDIEEGDLVVHSEYGIGRYLDISQDRDGEEEINIEYRDGAILSVPIDQSHLLARYVGMGGKTPQLGKLGDTKWSTTKKRAAKSILDYAAQLLKIQSERSTLPGIAHPADSKWMWEFEQSFRYTETPGQLQAIADTKSDMEAQQPMDRLICGDVGFGKTEVAIRAAFKAVTGGTQVALMAPTTVLAEQHWRTFRERMSDYPITIALLNRFRTQSEVKATLKGLADGSIDIVIGTHRLVSSDIHFHKLGLAIVDEEQRFGVKHKEKFKERLRGIDMLTLSATPIPRTLYLSLMGARDMSTIDTPPPNKVPVHTTVAGYDERLIKSAIERELARGGQTFFLHNRVKTIENMATKLQNLLPYAKIVIGHGQMEKTELEAVMRTFVEGKADILLSTTIIESGIDIPNANTIIIDRADRFGLSDLYQLRGRVGRAGDKAYALLLLPRELMSTTARKRINAIQQYTALGSGFKIAMRDLEIRGAGNLLGTKQSGHIAAIGFDLYCQLLKQSIDQLKSGKTTTRSEVTLRADFLNHQENHRAEEADSATDEQLPCYLPAAYIQDASTRIQAYKALAQASSTADLQAIETNWRDRFGPLPAPAEHLLQATQLKILAARANISAIEIQGQRLQLTRGGNYILLEGKRFPRLKSQSALAKLEESLHLLQAI